MKTCLLSVSWVISGISILTELLAVRSSRIFGGHGRNSEVSVCLC